MYDVMDVANYIVNRSIDIGKPVSNLKLQKLLYYSQVAKLIESGGDKLFDDEISAWRYGPVVEQVYHRFKVNVNSPIEERCTSRNIFNFDDSSEYNLDKIICEEDRNRLNKVIDSYKNYKPLDMVRKTHDEDPWIEAHDQKHKKYIDTNTIVDFYSDNDNLIYGIEL